MKTLLLFLALALPAVAGLPTPEEEIATLKAEKAKRIEAAQRAVNDWYALELSKKEKAALGKDGGAFAKERMAMLLCSVPSWTWEVEKMGDYTIQFNADGTLLHSAIAGKLLWHIEQEGVIITAPDGKKASVKIDAQALQFSGSDFAAGRKVKGKPLVAKKG